MVPVTPEDETLGFTMNHSIPALFTLLSVRAVSRAPQSFPFAKTTCCMRVSLLSRWDSTSGANGSGPPRTIGEQVGSFARSELQLNPTPLWLRKTQSIPIHQFTGECVDAGNLGRTTTMYFTLGCTLMVASSPVKYQIHTKVGGMVLMS